MNRIRLLMQLFQKVSAKIDCARFAFLMIAISISVKNVDAGSFDSNAPYLNASCLNTGLVANLELNSVERHALAADTPNLSPLFYDAENEELRNVGSKSSDQFRERNSWIARTPPARKTTNWNWNFLNGFAKVAFWGIVGLLLIALIGFIVYLVTNGDFGGVLPSSSQSKSVSPDISVKVSQLPFQMETPVEGLLELCQAARDRGEFNQATVYLFGHVLISLDDGQLIRLRKGKTNRMYTHELRMHPNVRSIYNEITIAFERVFFGRHEIDRQEFDRLWQHFGGFAPAIAKAQETMRQTESKNRLLPAGGTA